MAPGGAGGAGRSTAIVLFTDLVGSTELRSRLGENTAEELRHQHDAMVAGAVEASRGHLVKNLGDGIMATFTGASDAVGAAVAIQQALGRHNRSSAAALEVRIGISAGMSSSRWTIASARRSSRPLVSVARRRAGRFSPRRWFAGLVAPVGCVHPVRQPRTERAARPGPGRPGRLGAAAGVHGPAPGLPDRHRTHFRRPGRRARTTRSAVEGSDGRPDAGGPPGR